MKKLYKYIVFFIFILLFGTSYTFAYEIGDYVYFDPITTKPCTQKKYWTFYDQDTTCYRWVVLSDTNGSVKLLLDHNLANATFDNISTTLANKTSTWVRANNIDVLDNASIRSIIKLSDSQQPTTSQSVGSNAPHWLATNNFRYINGALTITSYGFWTKTSYDDTTAYRVTEYSNSRLSTKTTSLGVRPTITIDNSLVRRGWLPRQIAPTTGYNFIHAEKSGGYGPEKHTPYNQMQGATFTSNNLVFASTWSGSDGAVVMWQSGSNYATRSEKYFTDIGHCNDMTYNTQENKLIITGLSGGTDHTENNIRLYVINGETSNGSVTKVTTTRPTNGDPAVISYSGMGYDKYHNYYWGKDGMRVYGMDSNFNVKYSFEAPFLETGQGLEYHDGYVYIPVYEEGKYGYDTNSTYQLYFRGVDYNKGTDYSLTAKVYVYNAKLNADGTPSKEFGKLYLIYYIPRTNSLTGDAGSSKNNGQYGELETVTFKGNMMYLAISRKNYVSGTISHAADNYTYAFYKYDNSSDININYDLISATYGTNSSKKVISLYTKDELKSSGGWTTNDTHSIYTEVSQNTSISNPVIEDNYNNTTEATVDSPSVTLNNLGLDAKNNIIKNIPRNTTLNSLRESIDITNNGIITSSLGDNDIIKTGDMITIHTMNNDLTYTVSVLGDYNKDGGVNTTDARSIINLVLKNQAIDDELKYAADYNDDGEIRINDVAKLLANR